MTDSADPIWQRTLFEVERSVSDCLASLDRYEAAFAGVLESADERRGLSSSAAPASSEGWDSRLKAAKASAEQIDRLLAGSEAGWTRWQEAFSAWRRGIEQPLAVLPGEASHVEVRGDSAGGG